MVTDNHKSLKIVFFGTPDFATHILQSLVEQGHHHVVGVVTMPDKPAGRGHKLQPSSVKQYAESVGLSLLQPERLRDPHFIEALQALDADLFIVVAFRMLPQEVWGMPPRGTFNLHASLLPAYRGAAPIQHAILNGETVTGVTTFMLDEKIDTGQIIMRQEVAITDDETAGSLHDKLMSAGAELTCRTADLIASSDEVPQIPQDSLIKGDLPEAPKIFKEDRMLHFKADDAIAIDRRIRAMSPYPASIAVWQVPDEQPVEVKVFNARLVEDISSKAPGLLEVSSDERLIVHTRNGAIEILELQLPSKRRIAASDFIRGYQVVREQETFFL